MSAVVCDRVAQDWPLATAPKALKAHAGEVFAWIKSYKSQGPDYARGF
jgi:hypothetical protein